MHTLVKNVIVVKQNFEHIHNTYVNMMAQLNYTRRKMLLKKQAEQIRKEE